MTEQSNESAKQPWQDLWKQAGAQDSPYLDLFIEPMLQLALDHFAARPAGARILDVGCGRGRNTDFFRMVGMSPVGIDVDEESLTLARQRHGQVEFLRGDALHLPFPDDSFDMVFSFSVLQYVDWPAAIRECRRVLKPGGKAVFIENLRGAMFAIGYRLLHRMMKWRYGPHQTPRQHIPWEQRSEFEKVFSQARFTPFHLTTPAVLMGPALMNRFFRRPLVLRAVRRFKLLRQLDLCLLRRFPSLSGRCWMMVARAVK